jgi:hypothetical protein
MAETSIEFEFIRKVWDATAALKAAEPARPKEGDAK